MAQTDIRPTLDLELDLWRRGYRAVAGLDEAGRGALAGPVVAAAVVLPEAEASDGVWAEVRDSKQLSASDRMQLEVEIQAAALSWSVGVVPASVIDEIGIAPATRRAMTSAVAQLQPPADFLIIDWVRLQGVNLPQESRKKADLTIVSVAAASILAKVHRDRLLTEIAPRYPSYGFERNKGYGTRQHLAALHEFGPCDEHRYSFAPIAKRPTIFEERHHWQRRAVTHATDYPNTPPGEVGKRRGE